MRGAVLRGSLTEPGVDDESGASLLLRDPMSCVGSTGRVGVGRRAYLAFGPRPPRLCPMPATCVAYPSKWPWFVGSARLLECLLFVSGAL